MGDQESGFTYLDHTADVWVHAWGSSLEKAYAQTALALMDTMIASKNIRKQVEKTIEVKDFDKGSLLINFLSEFLYLFDVEGWIFGDIVVESIEQVSPEEYRLIAKTHGETFDRSYHEPDVEVKAITYSYLEINEEPSKSEIKIVFDI